MRYTTTPFTCDENSIIYFRGEKYLSVKGKNSKEMCEILNESYLHGATDMAEHAIEVTLEIKNEISDEIMDFLDKLK